MFTDVTDNNKIEFM